MCLLQELGVAQAQYKILQEDLLKDMYLEQVDLCRWAATCTTVEYVKHLELQRKRLLLNQAAIWALVQQAHFQAQRELVEQLLAAGEEVRPEAQEVFLEVEFASILPPPVRDLDPADVAAPARARMQSRMCQVREQGGVGCGVRACEMTTTSAPYQRAASIVVPKLSAPLPLNHLPPMCHRCASGTTTRT